MTLDTIAVRSGEIVLSEQRVEDIKRWHCESESAWRYALRNERSNCVCGHHENPVPLPPLFDIAHGILGDE